MDNDSAQKSKGLSLGEAYTSELTQTRFPCQQCGAVLQYLIGTRDLHCQYCGFLNQIGRSTDAIRELDLGKALRELQSSPMVRATINIMSCPNCAAEFALDAHIHAGECPFCSTPVVTDTGDVRPIKPKGLLPFAITADEAREHYSRWLSKLWFAPSQLKKFARKDTRLNGVYVPYWTYDSDTVTAYHGERGDVYYVTQRYTTVENGKRVSRSRRVPKVRWRRVSGRTKRHFDDVLIGATLTLPRKITDWLEPWDLENLEPYTEAYLSGFSSEIYQVNLDEGFNLAQKTMDRVIRGDVTRSIGGDRQRIHSMETRHSETTFKHVLLPLWSAAFDFRNKTYRFVVNGRTGKTRGERPYSVVKIAATMLTAVALVVGFVHYANESGMIDRVDLPGLGGGVDYRWDINGRSGRTQQFPRDQGSGGVFGDGGSDDPRYRF